MTKLTAYHMRGLPVGIYELMKEAAAKRQMTVKAWLLALIMKELVRERK